MNCFEWRNHASDYLDGSLPPEPRREADDHLRSCLPCRGQLGRFEELVKTVATQPRARLPDYLKDEAALHPLAAVSRSHARHTPLTPREQQTVQLKTMAQGLGVLFVVLAAVSIAPRIRRLYEQGLDESLNELNQSYEEYKPFGPGPEGTATAMRHPGASGDRDPASQDADGQDFQDQSESVEPENAPSRVATGDSEIWRFILKSTRPEELRARVLQILAGSGIQAKGPAATGLEVPGGIEFDLLVPNSVVSDIKRQLQALTPPSPLELANSPAGETFTWYKSKSRRPIPAHSARLIIWLPQL